MHTRLFALLALAALSAAAPDADCRALGFLPSLACARCADLARIVDEPAVTADCERCCTHHVGQAQFAGARLEVGLMMMSRYPEVAAFVEEQGFEGLEVVHPRRRRPQLVMIDEDGDAADTVNIANWKKDDIRSFLQEKLGQVG